MTEEKDCQNSEVKTKSFPRAVPQIPSGANSFRPNQPMHECHSQLRPPFLRLHHHLVPPNRTPTRCDILQVRRSLTPQRSWKKEMPHHHVIWTPPILQKPDFVPIKKARVLFFCATLLEILFLGLKEKISFIVIILKRALFSKFWECHSADK